LVRIRQEAQKETEEQSIEHLSLSYCLKIVLLFLDFEKGKYQSGQMGQTVNLLAYAFGGSNPSLPTKNCGSSSVDRALAFQAEGRGFEPRLPLSFLAVIAQW
jgi:hypothetical protein